MVELSTDTCRVNGRPIQGRLKWDPMKEWKQFLNEAGIEWYEDEDGNLIEVWGPCPGPMPGDMAKSKAK